MPVVDTFNDHSKTDIESIDHRDRILKKNQLLQQLATLSLDTFSIANKCSCYKV